MIPTCPTRRRSASGFTLIEVLIVVAMIAILAAVGYPSYVDYIRRGQLPEAFAALSDYRVKMEQYFQDYHNYGTTSGGNCANATGGPGWADFVPKNAQFFNFSCTVTDKGYTITATGVKGQAVGHVYTIDQDNVQATTQFKGQAVTKGCWLMKGSEC